MKIAVGAFPTVFLSKKGSGTGPGGCTCGIPLAYKRRTEAPKGKEEEEHQQVGG